MKSDTQRQAIQKGLPLIPAALSASLIKELIRAFYGKLPQNRINFPESFPNLF